MSRHVRFMSRDRSRRGASLVLIVIMLATFVVTAAITIDYAYMQLVQTELRVATDAAAKAGAEALERTERILEAKNTAIRYARLNTVGGDPLLLRRSDIEVGRLAAGEDGRWHFVTEMTPPNAVRVNGQTGDGALHPAVPLFFGRILGKADFSPRHKATAGQQQVEICLCLDRSGSMLFDMSGQDNVYPPNNPYLIDYTAMGSMWQNHLSPPHPTESRWAVLTEAIDLFLDEASDYTPPPRTSLVTWGSNYTMPVSPRTVFQDATIDVSLPSANDHSWNANRIAVTQAVHQLGQASMMGATNLSAGLDTAVDVLTGPNSLKLPNKIVILLTDGMWNEGRSPIEAAHDAKAAGIMVHTVTMLTAHQPDVAEVAAITGGKYYNTSNEQELRQAFEDLARSLRIVLTD